MSNTIGTTELHAITISVFRWGVGLGTAAATAVVAGAVLDAAVGEGEVPGGLFEV